MKFKRVFVIVLIVVLLVVGIPYSAFASARRGWSGGGEVAKFTLEDLLKAVAIPIVVHLLPEVIQHYWHYDDASGAVFTLEETIIGAGYGNFALLGKDNWVIRPSIGVAGIIRGPRYKESWDLMCLVGLITKFGKKHGFGVGTGLGYAFYQNSASLYLTICWPIVG